MSGKNGKGWSLKSKTLKTLGRAKAKDLFAVSKVNMRRGIEMAKRGDKRGFSKIHWAKIQYAEAKSKVAFGRRRSFKPRVSLSAKDKPIPFKHFKNMKKGNFKGYSFN